MPALLLGAIAILMCSCNSPIQPTIYPVGLVIVGPTSAHVGASIQLELYFKENDGSLQPVVSGSEWISGIPGVASVSSQGLVLAKARGMTRITAKHNQLQTYIMFRVD